MNPTRHNSPQPGPNGSGSAARSTAVRRTAARRALWAVGPMAVAVPVSVVLALARTGGDWMGALWLATVLCAIGATVVQALWRGVRHGDWSAFAYCDLPGNDDDFDYTTRSGEYLFMQVQADHEALMRDGDRFLQNHDHGDSLR